MHTNRRHLFEIGTGTYPVSNRELARGSRPKEGSLGSPARYDDRGTRSSDKDSYARQAGEVLARQMPGFAAGGKPGCRLGPVKREPDQVLSLSNNNSIAFMML